MLSRDQILAVDDLPIHVVEVPEWGGEVGVRVMTAAERDELERYYVSNENNPAGSVRAFTAYLALCDSKGERLFDQPEDIDALAKRNGQVLSRIVRKVIEVNGMGDDALAEAAKNS